MANIAAYSRHKMLEELNSPLYSSTVGGDTYFLTPDEQRQEVLSNLMNAVALPTGAAITTSATTVLDGHTKTSSRGGIIQLQLTSFAFTGTMADNTAAAFGASLISFPTETYVKGLYISGTITGTGADDRTTAVELGLGTAIGSGANATLGAQGVAQESILGGSASSAFADGGTTSVATILAPSATTAAANGGAGVVLRTSTPGLAVFFNGAGAAQDLTSDGSLTFTFTGSVALEYVFLT